MTWFHSPTGGGIFRSNFCNLPTPYLWSQLAALLVLSIPIQMKESTHFPRLDLELARSFGGVSWIC